ncbi:ribonuclease H1 [Carabus blaptoides fortunei]
MLGVNPDLLDLARRDDGESGGLVDIKDKTGQLRGFLDVALAMSRVVMCSSRSDDLELARMALNTATFSQAPSDLMKARWRSSKASQDVMRQGVPDNYLQTAKSYLDNRWTSLEYATGKTVKKQITKGCPQGSRSGPGYWKILYGTLFEEQLPEGRIHPADIADFEYNSEAINCTKAVKIYTDGSRTRNGAGAAFVAFCSEEEIGHGKERIGPLSTALQGELRAIQMGVQYALTKAGVMKECAILTDCKAALEKIRGLRKPTETVINIRELIQEAKTRGMQVTWFWVKAHKKDKGNARADELAKQAANDREAMVGFDRIPTSVIKSKTKAELRQKWQARWKDGATGRTTANFIPTVNIGEKIRTKITYQVTQLITDHGNMGAYLYYRKLAAQPMCECEGGRENSEHILMAKEHAGSEKTGGKNQVVGDTSSLCSQSGETLHRRQQRNRPGGLRKREHGG